VLASSLRSACKNNKTERTLNRHEHQELLDRGRTQSFSPEAVADRKRRQHLMERNFADAAIITASKGLAGAVYGNKPFKTC
jgi:hypothetical protein